MNFDGNGHKAWAQCMRKIRPERVRIMIGMLYRLLIFFFFFKMEFLNEMPHTRCSDSRRHCTELHIFTAILLISSVVQIYRVHRYAHTHTHKYIRAYALTRTCIAFNDAHSIRYFRFAHINCNFDAKHERMVKGIL